MNIRPIFHKGHKGRGILLIHGFTGSPLELKPLVDHFRGIGYSLYVPLLAGHGTTPEEMRRTNRFDWFQSVEEGYEQLLQAGNQVIYAAGLSMGGLLALQLARKYPLRAIATLSSPIFVHDKRIRHSRWLKYILPYKRRTERKAPHIENNIVAYPKTPLSCIHSLHELIEEVKNQLSQIHTPIMVVQGNKDETVDPLSADYIYKHIGSNYKRIHHYPNSSHIITLDHDRYQLFSDMAHFFEEVTLQVEGK